MGKGLHERAMSEKQINKWLPGFMKKLGFKQTEFETVIYGHVKRSNQWENANIVVSQLSKSITIFSEGKRINHMYTGSIEDYKLFKEYMTKLIKGNE